MVCVGDGRTGFMGAAVPQDAEGCLGLYLVSRPDAIEIMYVC